MAAEIDGRLRSSRFDRPSARTLWRRGSAIATLASARDNPPFVVIENRIAGVLSLSRIVILTEGKSNPTEAKTATGVLRYRGDDVVAVLDSTAAGTTARQLLGVGGDIPVVARLGDVEGDTLLIGIASAGGALPAAWRPVLREAIERGMRIVNGLHTFLEDDAELRELAAKRGVELEDVRRPPKGLTVSRNVARDTTCFRVHTVGHDCSVGKMVTALEITRALRELGHDAEFLATGQTGIMIAGTGVPIDAVVSDFVAGAIEHLVLEHADADFVLVEGQGSLIHPLYSGVTLGLLHGCAPQAMVMCVDPTRTTIKYGNAPMRPTGEVIEIYELMARLITPSRVVAVAVNTSELGAERARAEVDSIASEVGLPATDVVRFGVAPIVDAILAARGEHARRAESTES